MNASTIAPTRDLIPAASDEAPRTTLVIEDFDQWTGPVDATVYACGYTRADLAA